MKTLKKLALAAVAASPVLAFAASGPDLTQLTDAIDFTTVSTAVLAIAGLLATVYVAIRGAKTVIGMIRG
ncbi:MAG: major capsid protein [Betaproteobacteria bacterium]|nr:major capsid protein [Betaproteobacteria bacterium]